MWAADIFWCDYGALGNSLVIDLDGEERLLSGLPPLYHYTICAATATVHTPWCNINAGFNALYTTLPGTLNHTATRNLATHKSCRFANGKLTMVAHSLITIAPYVLINRLPTIFVETKAMWHVNG